MTGEQPTYREGVKSSCLHLSRGHGDSGALGPFRRRVLVSAAIILLPVVILAGAWRLGGASALEDDLLYYLPIRQYIGERIRAGELALWSPWTLMGTSVAADPQSGLWYPPTYLFALLPPLAAYPLTIVLHFALAGGGMYRFLRACRRDWRAALLGALAFEFCGYLVAHRAHLTIHHAAAWLPWLLYCWRRLGDTGRYRYFALASAGLGLQMLVQHMQVSIITGALLTGYVAVVLCPRRRALLWQYPLGMGLGVMISAVQLLPTWFQFAGSSRGTATYSLFIENSWVPTSGLMFLFPMLFGSRTPNLWNEPAWVISHFCEQSAYGSILILVLAGASLSLLRRKKTTDRSLGRLAASRAMGPEPGAAPLNQRPVNETRPDSRRMNESREEKGWDREIVFWWAASLVALVLAVGETPRFMPVSKWLFHLPLYRNLRVPARWILVWSVAMPVLASAVVSAMLGGGHAARRVGRWVRYAATRALPVVTIGCVAVMIVARWQADELARAYGDRYDAERVLAGLRSAIRPGNPAIWWPIMVMIATAWLLTRWSRTGRRRLLVATFGLLIVDLASVAAFVDVDVRTYSRSDLTASPPLAEAIRQLDPQPGHRLLVPRTRPDYDRPLGVLWPQTNVQHGIATFNGYGPFWPIANRLLFRFMPWGSSEAMLELLRNRPLMRAMGVRFVAVRTEQERALLTAAMTPAAGGDPAVPIPGSEQMAPVRYGHDVIWPIRLEAAGLYELMFDADPVAGSPSRWFVRLETASAEQIGWTRTLEPVDLSMGRRRLRFVFQVERAAGPAQVRIKSEMGQALSVGLATFRLIASGPAPVARATLPRADDAAPPAPGMGAASFVHRAELPGNISLYELPGAAELVHWANRVDPAADLREAVARVQAWSPTSGVPTGTVVEYRAPACLEPTWVGRNGPDSAGTLQYDRPAGHDLRVEAYSAAGGFIVFNESHAPGWTATMDSGPVAIHRVNVVCQGVQVPAGSHVIRFVYRPPGLTAGAGISIGAGLIVVAALAATTRRQREGKSEVRSEK